MKRAPINRPNPSPANAIPNPLYSFFGPVLKTPMAPKTIAGRNNNPPEKIVSPAHTKAVMADQ